VRSNAAQLGIAEGFFADHDIHMHVPAGAIPKDGPSAGVTMATTLVSLLSGHRIRPLTAMTGEITLSGNVLPVGGIKEKVLAAKRAGVTTVILPAENKMNVEEDLTPEQVENLSIHYVKTIEEALRVSLPVVAEALAAKVFLESEAKDSKPESQTAKTMPAPVVVHDKVVTWQS
jgi:ATP-dependent Lon protease